MLIGELSERTGFSRDTIRYYEKIALLPGDRRGRRHNNYRDYGESAVLRLQRIQELKERGFTLSEIRDLLAHVERTGACTGLPEALRDKAERLDAEIERLRAYRRRVNQALEACEGAACEGDEAPGTAATASPSR